MSYEFKLPDIGEGVVEGEIVRWLVNAGDPVEEDQPLVEIMTDKATVEIPSPLKGTIHQRIGEEGEVILVGTTMVVIEEAEGQHRLRTDHLSNQSSKLSTAVKQPSASKSKGSEGPILATPAVRRLARERGIDLSLVTGKGRGGRITKEDLERFSIGETRLEDGQISHQNTKIETVPYRGIRKRIGDHMVASKRMAPHISYVDEVDVTELITLREKLQNSEKGKQIRLKYLPFLMKAVVMGLKEFPLLNSTIDEANGVIVLKKYYNIGIATDTPEGLIVPVVQDVDMKDIWDLALEVEKLAETTRTGRIKLDDLKDGTFTITSMGSLGGISGAPIINYPEVAIIAVHKIDQKPVVRKGEIVIRQMMNLSMSMDHRVVDGAVAARFLHYIIPLLENPEQHLSTFV